jgi:putative flavoprotein involved in K+ transport
MRLEALSDVLAPFYGDQAKAQGITTELADLLFAAIPLRIMLRMQQRLVSREKQRDAEFYQRLRSVGFQVTFGEDETGVFPQVLRDPGRYYIDVGASELIIDGSIKLRSGVGVTGLGKETVVLSDGSELPADVVFYATGYERKRVASIIGEKIAASVGWLWGFGSGTGADPGPWEGEIRNIGKPTQQAGLWFLAGGPAMTRSYSRILALQIKARHAGMPTPVYKLAKVFHAE